MFRLLTADNGTEIAINPNHVVSVKEVPPGVEIRLQGGHVHMVTDSYATVIQILTS